MNTCQLCEGDLEDGYLCVACALATRAHLERWPALYRGLAAFLAPRVGGARVRGAHPVHAPLPVNEDVLDLRAGGLAQAAEGWAEAVRRDRRAERPAPLPVGRSRPSCALPQNGRLALDARKAISGTVEARLVAAVAELLDAMPWIVVSWPDAGAFAADVRDVTRSLSSMFVPPTPRAKRLGNCPAQFEDGVICGAAIRLEQEAKVARCPYCGTTYPPATWADLKVLMDADAKVAAA
ncbi:predicted protein [Streptomyces sp. SPB78]|uniref:hypothetical protein n=1 Tax=Streptomyces sp. (strain SPB78) TaxID=591157 RepID=UPI0001B56EA2|nr:hypothetical protein [Streptomyces sp. SPB78]EFL01611.1 predicted protein [Streptomyces sp. SPB78]